MKEKNTTLKAMATIPVIVLCLMLLITGNTASAKSKTEKIVIKTGQTYQIKLAKKSRIVKCKSEVIKVKKSGRVKALKAGKCIVTIKTKKNIRRIKFVVRNNNVKNDNVKNDNAQDEKQNSNEEGSTTENVTTNTEVNNLPKPGGAVLDNGYKVDKIESGSNETSTIYLTADAQGTSVPMLLKENQAVKYIIVNCSNTKLAEGNIKEGDKVKIGYYTKSMNKRIENEKMYIEISEIFKEE